MTVSIQHIVTAHMSGRAQAEAEIHDGAVAREAYVLDDEMTPQFTPSMLGLSIIGSEATELDGRILAGNYRTGYSMAWDAYENGTTLPEPDATDAEA